MRKFIILIILSLSMASVSAQNVYLEIRSSAKAIADNPSVNEMVRIINTFKVDALDYLIIKMREQMPDSTTNFLDRQAYAMNNFINYYVQTIIDSQSLPNAQVSKVISKFMDFSYSNPLFKDDDKEITEAYLNNDKSIIKFSLNTDWRRAGAAAASEIKRD